MCYFYPKEKWNNQYLLICFKFSIQFDSYITSVYVVRSIFLSVSSFTTLRKEILVPYLIYHLINNKKVLFLTTCDVFLSISLDANLSKTVYFQKLCKCLNFLALYYWWSNVACASINFKIIINSMIFIFRFGFK